MTYVTGFFLVFAGMMIGYIIRYRDRSEDEVRQIEEDRAKAEASAKLRDEDYQLAYAIDILKGLSAIEHNK